METMMPDMPDMPDMDNKQYGRSPGIEALADVKRLNELPLKERMRLAAAFVIARWRHRKRGSDYNVLTETAQAQCSTGPINDDDQCTVYQGDDGSWWVRKTTEFQDGRFIRVDTENEA
jgi:hypothetical protein